MVYENVKNKSSSACIIHLNLLRLGNNTSRKSQYGFVYI